jgi:hypothetical protein
MNIVFVLFENVTQLDFTGPVQFLSRLPGVRQMQSSFALRTVVQTTALAV